MQVRTLTPDDREWRSILDRIPHDFYHTPEYHAFAETSGEGQSRMTVIGANDRLLVWPYLIRPCEIAGTALKEDWVDVHSVYGYPGPLAGPDSDDEFLAQAMVLLLEYWREQRVVSVFSRLHPILENGNLLVRSGWADALHYGGSTVSLNATLDDAAATALYSAAVRKRIRRAEKMQLRTVIDENYERLPDFVRFYHATMDRNQAAESYYWSEDYFRRLLAAMAPHIKLLLTTDGDQLMVASLFSQYGRISQAHLIMTNPEFLHLSPSKAAIDHVRIWARSLGCRWLHLGGGRGSAEEFAIPFQSRLLARSPFISNRPHHSKPSCLRGTGSKADGRLSRAGRRGRQTFVFP